MKENKIIKAIMGDVNKSLQNVENYKIDGDTSGAIQELDKLSRKIEEIEQQFKTSGGEGFSKNVQEAFSSAKSQIEDYMNFLSGVKDQLEFGEISRNASQNFDLLKNKFNDLMQTLNGVVNNPALDDFTKKLESIKDVNFDISDKVRQFDSQLGEMGKSVEKLKQNIEAQLQLIDFGSIGGNNALSEVDRVLSSILERVSASKDQIGSELGEMISSEKINTEGATEKLNDFVNEVKKMSEEIVQVSNEINKNFGSLFSNLSEDLSNETVSMLEKLSDVISSLKDNNVEIKNPLSELITSLKSINEQDINMISNLSSAIDNMLNIKVDQGSNAVTSIMELTNGIHSMKSSIEDAMSVFQNFTNFFNSGNVLGGFSQQVQEMQTKMTELNNAMNEVSSTSQVATNTFQQPNVPVVAAPSYNPNQSTASSPWNPRPDQFYASGASMQEDMFQDKSYREMIAKMKNTHNTLGGMMWDSYEEERYGHGGNAPWNTRQSNKMKEALIDNNEISAILNALDLGNGANSSLRRDIKGLSKNPNAYGNGSADEQFARVEGQVDGYIKNIEKLLSKFNNMKDIDVDDSFDNVLLEMVNNGRHFVDKFDEVLKELPSELRRKLQGNNAIEEFQDMVSKYNAEALNKTLNTDLRGKYASENSYAGNGSDFFLQLLSGSSIKGSESSLISAMNTSNDLSGHYSDPQMRIKMLSAGKHNSHMLNKHEQLMNSLGDDDHNLIMKNAVEFMESGKLSINTNSGVMNDLSSSIDKMNGVEASKTIDVLKEMDSQAKETGTAIKAIMENLIGMMELKLNTLEGDEKNKFEEQLDKIKEKLSEVNEEMSKSSQIRTAAFEAAASSPLTDTDFQRADDEAISYLTSSHSRGHGKIQKQTSRLRNHAYAAKVANMTGNRKGGLSNSKLDDVSDVSRNLEAQMIKMNNLRSEFDEAAADPSRREEAKEKALEMNKHQSQMNNLAKQLAKQVQMSDKDLKDAPPEIKNVYNAVQEMVDSTKSSNVEMMQLNELLGIDHLNEDLVEMNKELDKAKHSGWDRFKNSIDSIGSAIKSNIINPLQSIGGFGSNLMKGGMSAMGLGSMGALAVNPFSLSSIMGGVTKLAGDMFQADIAQGQAKNTVRSSEMMQYGMNSGTHVNTLMDQGLQLQDNSYGLINYADLTRTYAGLTSNVVGQYGQADVLAQSDMRDFSDTSLALQKGYGISEGAVNESINTFYKELKMNVNETEYELAKIGQTAQSLNVPFSKHLENVTSMAKQYKTMGFEASYASDVVGNLMFQHGMTYDDASSIAGKAASAVTGMSDGWTAFTGMMGGYSANPLEAVVGLQYGYNQDGTLKEGVIDQRIENLQSRYDMMSMLGGSAGDYAVVKSLNSDGFSNREAGMILDAMKNGDKDYIRDMFTKSMEEGFTDEEGNTYNADNPDEYFNTVFDKINASAEEQLSVTEKILATYQQGIDEIVHANQDLFDSLEPLIGVVDGLMESLGTFVGGLDEFIAGIQNLYGDLKSMIDNSFMGDWGASEFLGAGALAAGGLLAGKVVGKAAVKGAGAGAKALWNKATGKNKKGSSSDDDDYDYDDDDDNNNKNRSSGSGGSSGSSKNKSWKNALKRGGKAGLLVGGASLLGGMLFNGDEVSAAENNDWSSLLGNNSYGDDPATESAATLKDIYNVLTGNGATLVTGSGGSSSIEENNKSFLGLDSSSFQNALLAAGVAGSGVAAYSMYKDRKSGDIIDNDPDAKIKAERQAVVDAEEAARKQRVKESYDLNRASGQSAAEAKKNADFEENLRSNSGFNRPTQADYDDLFKKPGATGTLKNLLKTGASSIKAVPLVGTAASLGLGAWQVNSEFEDINAIAHMTGGGTGVSKANSLGNMGLSTALMAGGAAIGSIIPGAGTVAGAVIGGGIGLGLDWLGDKTGAKDWLLDSVGIGSQDSKESIATEKQLQSAENYQKRMKSAGYNNIDDNFALVAAGAMEKNSQYLSGMSQEGKDAWASQFAEEYLSKIADGVDPQKAEALAKEQANELLEIKLGTEDVRVLNQEQLTQMLDLYSLTGENKEVLSDYSSTYFKREEDAKKVLDATSEATGLSYETLLEIAESMNLLPNELAALIAMNSGGSENVASSFLGEAEVEEIRKGLEKNDALSKTTIESTVAHMVENDRKFSSAGLSADEKSRYAEYYSGMLQTTGSASDAAKYAEDSLTSDRRADEVLSGKGLASAVLKYQRSVGNTGAKAIGSSITNAQVKDAISTTAAASGTTEWQIKQALKRQGINEKMYASYLLENVDGKTTGEVGKIGKGELKGFLGDKSSVESVHSVLSKSLGNSQEQINKMQKAYEQADTNKEENQKFLDTKVNYTEDYTNKIHADTKEQRVVLQEADQKYKTLLQEEKKAADFTNTNSIITALGSLGDIIGTKIADLGSALSALTGLVGGGNSGDLSSYDASINSGVTASTLNSKLGGVLKGKGQDFIDAGKKYGVDPALVAAIAMHETGNGTSNAAKNKNNVGGMMGKNGLMTFDSIEDGIDAMTSNLKRLYIDQGLTSIEEIQKKYAPVGAANDPTGLNKNWVDGVSKFLTGFGVATGGGGSGGAMMGGSKAVADYYLDIPVSSPWMAKNRVNHKGVDLAASAGTDLYAIASGTVKSAGYDKSAGNYVTIEHEDGALTKYYHLLEKAAVKVGQKVAAGQFIGDMGSTGNSTGPHLHLEYWKNGMHQDPIKVLKKLSQSGGIGGGPEDDNITGGTGALTKAIEEQTTATKEATDAVKTATETASVSRPILTNASAYDAFSGIHPTNSLDYNRYAFGIYNQLGMKTMEENEWGVNYQELSKTARNAFDINVKTSIDPTQSPNFTRLLDKYMKVAVKAAADEAASSIDSSYSAQFSEVWETIASQISKTTSIE